MKAYFLLFQKEYHRFVHKIVKKEMQFLYQMENVNFECHQLFRYTFEIILNIFYFQLMSKKQTSFLNNWAEVGDPNSGIVRESSTGREGERRIVALDPLFDPKNQQFIYNYRRETKTPFVNAYGSELLALEKPPKSASKDKKEVSDPYNHLAVITERIPFRLVDAPQLTYPQSLYVLDRSLEGFETAYEKCGPMRVNDRLIGFNNQGECKVWINEDFANNHPSYPRRRLMTTRPDSNQYLAGSKNSLRTSIDEADMVQDVVDTVENYSEEGRFPEPFATRIHQRDLSFAQARRLLQENITEHRIPVPNRVDLITNRVRGFKKVTTTQQHHVQQVQQVVTPVTQTQTTTVVQKPVQGYRFNYLPVEQPFHPNIFASRVGEHGVYNGHVY